MNAETSERRRLQLTGIVQGVGLRPFVYRLAQRYGLRGWVANHSAGVCVEVQGDPRLVQSFEQSLAQELTLPAEIHSLKSESIPLEADRGFRIRASMSSAAPSTIVLPDMAPCEACLQELFDPQNRRYRYPFINCTHCGPRFTIVEQLPYDRAHTAMKVFPLCAQCRAEYTDPQNRRFHAEPNACADCGPQLTFCAADGNTVAEGEGALQQAIAAIRAGQIIAVKNIGGFQLLADATNADAVARLRHRKQRPHKPFALLYPDLESVRRDCVISTLEAQQLNARERPILLLRTRPGGGDRIARAVAPANPNLGVMLPSSPLHYLLMRALSQPLVATSGNLAGEPICIDNREAVQRLGQIADGFLMHNRAIRRPLDDSVVRVMDGQPVLLRRARGYAPRPFLLPDNVAQAAPLLAVGSDLKNTVAVARGNSVYVSQHIGDLENRVAATCFEQAIGDLTHLYDCQIDDLACDLHPGFHSTRWGKRYGVAPRQIQHHVAHFFSCLAEHAHAGPALGICWDGTGYGEDGTLRGSEFLHWHGNAQIERVASLREFPLPGSAQAIREPRRVLAGLCYEFLGGDSLVPGSPTSWLLRQYFADPQLNNLHTMLCRALNSPRCSSIGRLFDGVSALLGLVETSTFEGQAAMAVEFAAQDSDHDASYPFTLRQHGAQWTLDWGPMLMALIEGRSLGVSRREMATVFHNTLAEMAVAVANRVAEQNVFLSGGAFQNKRLLETTTRRLRAAGFRVHCHGKIPPNDGGIAFGQIYYARCIADATGALSVIDP